MCRSIIVNAGSKPQLEDLLQHVAIPLVIICPDRAEMTEPAAKFLARRFIGANALPDAEQWRPVEVAVDSIAYLLFTSGSFDCIFHVATRNSQTWYVIPDSV
jgi:hypothetical protein